VPVFSVFGFGFGFQIFLTEDFPSASVFLSDEPNSRTNRTGDSGSPVLCDSDFSAPPPSFLGRLFQPNIPPQATRYSSLSRKIFIHSDPPHGASIGGGGGGQRLAAASGWRRSASERAKTRHERSGGAAHVHGLCAAKSRDGNTKHERRSSRAGYRPTAKHCYSGEMTS